MDTGTGYLDREAISQPQHNSAPRSAQRIDVTPAAMTIGLIEPRSLHGECLAIALRAMAPDVRVMPFASCEQWHKDYQPDKALSLILYCCQGRFVVGGAIDRAVAAIKQKTGDVPVILMSEIEDPDTIIEVIGSGIQGYIPTSASLNVALEAMRLVHVGGTYLPASAIINRHRQAADQPDSPGYAPHKSKFTGRQQAVLSALRQGKANKLIAYELDLRESTVKVHMRNIMKKLHATNRTEVVCMLNEDMSRSI